MALKADYRFTWAGDAFKKIAAESSNVAMQDVGRRIAREAKTLSPYATGHNRASIAVVTATGRIQQRQQPKRPKEAPKFSDAATGLQRGSTAVLTTSGYGGYLEIGAKAARYTKKGKKRGKKKQYISSGGKVGSYYITRASAKVLKESGETEAALQIAFAVRAKRAEIREVRAAKGST